MKYEEIAKIQDQFQLIEVMEGGLAELHVAIEKKTKSKVVLKRTKKQRPNYKVYSLREAEIVYKLRNCRFTRKIYRLLKLPSSQFVLVLEYYPASNLHVWANSNFLTQPILKNKILVPMVKALCELRLLGVIHRDIKEKNVLFDGNALFLIDFNASCTGETGSSKIGTQKYMAPEVYSGSYGHQVDVYSFGVMLISLAFGGRSVYSFQQQNRELYSAELKSFIQLCISKNPEDRTLEKVVSHEYLRGEQFRLNLENMLEVLDRTNSRFKLLIALWYPVRKFMRCVQQVRAQGCSHTYHYSLFCATTILREELARLEEALEADEENFVEYDRKMVSTLLVNLLIKQEQIQQAFILSRNLIRYAISKEKEGVSEDLIGVERYFFDQKLPPVNQAFRKRFAVFILRLTSNPLLMQSQSCRRFCAGLSGVAMMRQQEEEDVKLIREELKRFLESKALR